MNIRILAAALSAVASSTAVACMPYVQPSYIYSKNPYDIQLEKDAAIKQVVESVKDLLPPPTKFGKGTTTLEAEILDFTAAVNDRCAAMPENDRKKLISDFSAVVTKWRTPEVLGDRAVDNRLIPLPELPAELDEFKLYLEGYDYLMRNDPDHIPPAWDKLLKLPAKLRHYRTAWVHFMLGNHFKKDLHTHYDNCRNAVRQGFADTPGLALRSYTLEIRYGKNMTQVIRRAAEAELCNSGLPFLDSISLDKINKLDDGAYFALVEDSVCREFLALLDGSGRFRTMIMDQKLRNADICAYYSYIEGDITEARKFISILENPTLLSVYLEAKIARFNNNIPLVVEKLRLWLKMLKEAKISPAPSSLTVLIDPVNGCNEPDTEMDVYGMLGSAMVFRRDFMEAAKFFYNAGQETDLQDIAEQFMTTEQLFAFVDSIAEDAKKEVPQKHEDGRADHLHKYAIAKSITYLAARRAFREEKFDSAIKYMPSDTEKKLVSDYVGFIRKGNDTSQDDNSRALALYNAAKILKNKGMELCGTAGSPDFYPGRFGFTFTQCRDCNYLLATGEWILCSEHRDMTITHPGFNSPKNYKQVTPHIRYHYRYQAAELALRAGILAKDEQLRALIYLFGGHCLRRTSPQEADIFYKRLVRECRKSKLGKLADASRWFPTIHELQKEMNSTEPCDSLDKVYELMRKSFPKEK